MKTQLGFCIKKDFQEFMRKKRLLVYSILWISIGLTIFLSARFFPGFIDMVGENAPDIITSPESLKELFDHFFPNNISEHMAVLSAELIAFYSITAIFIVEGLLPKEIKKGCFIIPLGAGYKMKNFILSKALVNGIGAALPMFVFYNLYYLMTLNTFYRNYTLKEAFINSLILSFLIFVIVVMTIFSSVIFKHPIASAISIIMIVMVSPDIFSFFFIGKYLPSHLIHHMTTSATDFQTVLIPILVSTVMMFCFYLLAVKRTR